MSVYHKLYIGVLTSIVLIITVLLINQGYSYYFTGMEDRFFHQDHNFLKPSGPMGHGLGIFGSLFMVIGVIIYVVRKRARWMMRMGRLKYWLEFHIFLCTMGPIMVLFHSAFKFGGLVAISFWSMVAVFLSGIIGRFIYIQIPRSIEGRELTLAEVREMKTNIGEILRNDFHFDDASYNIIIDSVKKKIGLYQNNLIKRYYSNYQNDRRSLKAVKKVLRKNNTPSPDYKKVITLVKNDISINRKIERLVTMQNLFKYWHVIHMPFALVMLVIMIIHVAVTIVFGYRWIF